MLPYLLLFLLPSFFAAKPAVIPKPRSSLSPTWRLMFVVLVLVIGLRHQVGGDWFSYEDYVLDVRYQTFLDAVASGDPAYGALNWLTAQFNGGVYLVNTICALIFSWGLVVFCRAQPRPWLALVVALPYLVTVVAMGYTRQAVAIGLAMLALVALSEQRLVRFVVLVAIAATFHKSAVILMPLAILAGSRKRIWTVAWVGVSSAFFYFLLLQDSVDSLTRNYIEAEYESAGAAVRVAMNAMPSAIFLLFRRRFATSAADRSFWTWMALAGLAFVGLLVVSPSSTAVDRMALYWIPLQLFVLSRLPNAFGSRHGRNNIWVILVVAYSVSVLFIWLNFATNARAWLPYQFYPWVLLWN